MLATEVPATGPKRRVGPASVFAAASLAGGLLLCFFVPPFQGPDEPAHFYRALSVSQGALLPRGASGDQVPSAATLLASRFDRLAARPESRTSVAEILDAANIRADGSSTPVSFPGTSIYSPVPYLPAAAGILAARSVSDHPLHWLWGARLFSLAFATVVLCLALWLSGEWGWFLLLLAAAPMALFVRVTCSADTLTMAAAVLVVGLCLFQSPRGQAFWLVPAALLLALCKPPYGGLALLVLCVPSTAFRSARQRLVVQAAVLSVAAAGMFATTGLAARGLPRAEQADSIARKVAEAKAEPVKTALVILEDYARHAPRYVSHFVGRLGWLDAPVPFPFVIAFLAVLAWVYVSTIRASEMAKAWQLVTLGAVVGALMFAISLSLFLTWTPPGLWRVEGVQGRYFLPFAPTLSLVARIRRPLPRAVTWLAIAGVAAAVLTTLLTVWRRYYG